MAGDDGYYILLLSVHGLIRGRNPELGRDADTGGQVKYVIELARELAADPRVGRVELVTRLVEDKRLHADYSQPTEELGEGARIVRIPFGPRRYLRKETLWPYLDSFADLLLQYLRQRRQIPHLIHSHYADAGYVGTKLAGLLGRPLVFTGHSLGKVKRKRLLERGMSAERIESRYNILQRIEAEEETLDHAAMVVASTHQEVNEQYALYANHHPDRMVVIPPGVDLQQFSPPPQADFHPPVAEKIDRFLASPELPPILALARPDPRKNLPGLIEAYARAEGLRKMANLILVAGTRSDITSMEPGPRRELTRILQLIDKYDLYGSVAYPKQHDPDEVADIYRLAASRKGVFVNPAFTEPFGLTLIEAAASGLPILATDDGGPKDIVRACRNGRLFDPMDTSGLGELLIEVISDASLREKWGRNGLERVHKRFSWGSHVKSFLEAVQERTGTSGNLSVEVRGRERWFRKAPLAHAHRLVISDIDNTLIGDPESLRHLLEVLGRHSDIGFGVATGRHRESALKVLEEWGCPVPDLVISSVGTRIDYGRRLLEDRSWKRQIAYRWKPEPVRQTLTEIPGLQLQPQSEQSAFKISFFVDSEKAPQLSELRRILREKKLHARLIFSHGELLDALPIRASKGEAIRWVAQRWSFDWEQILVAGDSGNDIEMLQGYSLGVVVGNHAAELSKLRKSPRVYFAKSEYAAGILEGIKTYNFLKSREDEGQSENPQNRTPELAKSRS